MAPRNFDELSMFAALHGATCRPAKAVRIIAPPGRTDPSDE
jgi:poly(3-hydroxybutyrate) depolymerase